MNSDKLMTKVLAYILQSQQIQTLALFQCLQNQMTVMDTLKYPLTYEATAKRLDEIEEVNKYLMELSKEVAAQS